MATPRAIKVVSQWEDIRGDGRNYSETRMNIMVSMLDELRDEIRGEQDEKESLTHQQWMIRQLAFMLMTTLAETVPPTTLHYAVTDIVPMLAILGNKAGTIKTKDVKR